MQAGSVDSIERFMDAHEKSKINSEATIALYAALLKELEKARAVGTLAALRGFRTGDPRASLVESERTIAQKALFRAALARFQADSAGAPELEAFFERLLAYAEQHGPKVEIRFRRRVPASALMIETQLQKSSYFGGSKSLPMQYFDDKHAEAREAMIASAISQRFAAVFPKDILNFELGPAKADDDASTPGRYRADPADHAYDEYGVDLHEPQTSRRFRGNRVLVQGAAVDSSRWRAAHIHLFRVDAARLQEVRRSGLDAGKSLRIHGDRSLLAVSQEVFRHHIQGVKAVLLRAPARFCGCRGRKVHASSISRRRLLGAPHPIAGRRRLAGGGRGAARMSVGRFRTARATLRMT